jgi:hypothetical protein
MLRAEHGMACSAGITPAPDARGLTGSPAGVLRIDARGVVRHADARACVTLGYGRGDLVGRAVGDVLHDHADGSVVARRRDASELPVEVFRALVPAGRDGLLSTALTLRLSGESGLTPGAAAAAAAMRREDALVALVDAVIAGHGQDELAMAGVRAVADGLDADGAALLELSPEGGLAVMAETGARAGRTPREPTARLAFALEDGASVLDDPAPSLGAVVAPPGDGIVAVIRAGGTSFGLLCAHGVGHRAFGGADRAFLGIAAELLGAALEAPPVQPASRTGTGG